MGRRLALCLILLSLPAFAGTAGALAAAGGPHLRTTLPSVEHEVMCVTCKIPLQVARSPQASLERDYIQTLVNQGLTKTQIKRELVTQYGESVLALPTAHGINLAVYIVPLAVVLALIAVLATLLPAWRRHARAALGTKMVVADHLDSAETARLDADLARFD